jgi:glycosyltransferase involved in cell wall biosynthesis
MRIAVNLAAIHSVGTRAYAQGFVPALAEQAAGDALLLFCPGWLASAMRGRLPAWVELRVVPGAERVAARLVWEQAVLPLQLRRWRADALLAPMELAPLLSPCPVLLAVHNPSPHLGGGPGHWLRRRLSALSARVSRRVVFVSHSSADFLGARLAVPAAKRVVIPHGTDPARWAEVSDARATLARYGLSDMPYLLYVSQLYRYKDPETLIEAFGLWQAAEHQPRHRLVLTGTAVERGYRAELEALVRRRGLTQAVRFLGLVPAEDLPALYCHAAAFVLPTRVETFGQPFVEAMAAGAPVVCADIDVAREVCGEAAVYFPPGDAPALAARLRALTGDPNQRAALVRSGRQRAAAFTWEREARETLELLREIAEAGRAQRATPSAPARSPSRT